MSSHRTPTARASTIALRNGGGSAIRKWPRRGDCSSNASKTNKERPSGWPSAPGQEKMLLQHHDMVDVRRTTRRVCQWMARPLRCCRDLRPKSYLIRKCQNRSGCRRSNANQPQKCPRRGWASGAPERSRRPSSSVPHRVNFEVLPTMNLKPL